MREIKFRAWNEFEEHFVDSDEYAVTFNGIIFKANLDSDTYNNLISNKNLKLMQYTGLKDKNDVEIYEGDIVSFTLFDCFDNDMQHIGKILFNNGAFYIEYMDKCESYNSLLYYVISQDDEFEVIGNIHENQELLN